MRLSSLEVWGSLVDEMLIVGLAGQALAWGNREPALRAMLNAPAERARVLGRSLGARLPGLLLAVFLLGALRGPSPGTAWTSLWIAAALLQAVFDPLVAATRRLGAGIAAELLGCALAAALLLAPGDRGEGWLLRALALGAVGRALALVVLFPAPLRLADLRPRLAPLREATPFAILGVLGFLHSRAGLLAATRLLPAGALGEYQLVSGLLLHAQAGAAGLLLPFLQASYRASARLRARLAARLRLASLVLAAATIAAVAVVARLAYALPLPPAAVVGAALGLLALLGAQPDVYALFRVRREREVAALSALGAAIHGGLVVLLAPRWSWTGALLAAAGAQAVVAVGYRLAAGRSGSASALT